MRRSGDGGWFLLPRGGKRRSVLISVLNIKKGDKQTLLIPLAGETRLEHATGGFGDRCSTN